MNIMAALAARELADILWKSHQEMIEDGLASELTSVEEAFKEGILHACAATAVHMDEVTKNKTLAQRN